MLKGLADLSSLQAGIVKVVYLCDKSRHKPLSQAARTMFDMAGA